MAVGPVSLNNGPPLPPQLAPQPQPSVGQLAGPPPQQPANPSGSASLQQAVISKLMFVEQTLQDVATMMPAAAGAVDGFITMLRKGIGPILAQGATPPPASGIGLQGSSMLGPGGMGNAPTS